MSTKTLGEYFAELREYYSRNDRIADKPSVSLTYRNDLPIKPYIPRDPGRRARLLAANEMINRARDNSR